MDGSYYYYDKQDSVIVFKNPNDKKYAQGDKLYANYYFTYRFHTYPIWEIPLEFIHNHPYVKTDIPSSPDYKVENSNFVLFNFPISKDYTLMRYTFSDEYGDTNLLDYELISINPYYGDMERIDSIRLALKNVRQDFIDRQIVESILLKLDSYTIIEKDKGMFDYKLKYSLVKP